MNLNRRSVPHTLVCFKKHDGFVSRDRLGSSYSINSRTLSLDTRGLSWVALELQQPCTLILHNFPNQMVQSIVGSVSPIRSVSRAVTSVIKDYTDKLPRVTCSPVSEDIKFVRLSTSIADIPDTLVACLTNCGYHRLTTIGFSSTCDVFYFLKTS